MKQPIALLLAFVFCFAGFAFGEAQTDEEEPASYVLADCLVYLKDPDALSNEGFVAYAASLGFNITLHPDTQYLSGEGFRPLCLEDGRFDPYGNLFLTGFECDPSGWQKIACDAAEPGEDEASFILLIRCYSGIDYFGPLAALLFGAYCVKTCDGAFEDFEAEAYYDDPSEIEREIAIYTDFLISEAKQGSLCSQPFEGWQQESEVRRLIGRG